LTRISGPWSGLTAEQLQQGFEIDEKLQAVFGSPTYYNEQSDFLANWQDSIWGSNYDRLLSIKKEYDPNNLFACKYCVGSEDGY
jgi:FAD/FMN-containing dehydrogenase